MQARDIMTTNVVTASPQTTVGELAKVMIERRISALPVVTASGQMVGIVTESDLLHRQETNTEHKRKWWVDFVLDPSERSREFVKSHGQKAEDIMSRVVITVKDDAELADVAQLLDKHRIRRVPVMRDDQLVGIISRADLVRTLVKVMAGSNPQPAADAASLNKAIYDALRKEAWLNTLYVTYDVRDGVVDLRGFVDSAEQREAVRVLVEGVPGVKAVQNNLKPHHTVMMT